VVDAFDPPFGYTWQRWKDAVSLGADFYDGDGDGIYNPIDKNWNGTWDTNEDMPDLLGDVTAWCVYNDGVPAIMRERFVGIAPQGIEVEQTLFASSKPELENIIFIRYKLTNKATVADVLDSVIFSFWADPDLGDHLDDLVGCDTLLSSFFTYNGAPDAQYGNNPPAHFITLLQGPQVVSNNSSIAYNRRGISLGLDENQGMENLNISAFINYIYFDPDPIPDNEIFFRNRMKGLQQSGSVTNPCNFMAGEVRGGVDCNKVNPFFWYSGDPVEDVGWMTIIPTDQLTMLSVGEFTLEKDKPVTIIGAYVVGRGTDAINSITVARENVHRAIQEYLSNFASLTYDPGEPTNPVVNYVLYQNYPNPFNPSTKIKFTIPTPPVSSPLLKGRTKEGFVTLKVYDILGNEIATLVNEELSPGEYEVEFSAESPKGAGSIKHPASGIYFYQLRAGSFVQARKMVLIK
jgi:hypothetical protein